MFEFSVALMAYIGVVILWRRHQLAHEDRLARYRIRIHVNGIRGKSSVTRLVAAVLREKGIRTVAKATGSEAVLIDTDGRDHPLVRRGAPNVREQMAVIKAWQDVDAEAMVMECMAVDPRNQAWLERKVVQSHIGIITNVREDHQDVMGETLPQIARSLANTIPRGGVLITAEDRPDVAAVLRAEARRRGTRVVQVDPSEVSQAEMARFKGPAFAENVAIGLAVARVLGIDRATAMRGMTRAQPDAGAVPIRTAVVRGRRLVWANLFAVNDRQSAIMNVERLAAYCREPTVRIGVLNNRRDRERRAEQFAHVAARDLDFDWLITLGAFEALVTQTLVRDGFSRERIANLSRRASKDMDSLLDVLAEMIPPTSQALLVGLGNVHTPEAEAVMAHFEGPPRHQASRTGMAMAGMAAEPCPVALER